MSPTVTARTISLIVLAICIAALGLTFYHLVAPFLLPLFLAAVMAIIVQPMFRRMMTRTKQQRPLAAGLTTVMVMAVVLIPLLVGTVLAASELITLSLEYLSEDSLDRSALWKQWVEPVLQRAEQLLPGFHADKIQQELSDNSRAIAEHLSRQTFQMASTTIGAALSLLIALGSFVVALYYFLADGPSLLTAGEQLIPLPIEHQRRLREQFARVTRAVVLATFLAAFAQGLATAGALYVLGFRYFLGLLVTSTIASLIPVAGTWIVWVPCAVWLGAQGHWAAAIGLALWGMLVVSLVDNVVRIYVLNSDAQLHPLLGFISVLGALQVMGLWGIFIGPIVASCLYALLQIFNDEVQALAEPRPTSPVLGEPAPSLPLVTADHTPSAAAG
jgi:predicted PurR-regulated permease PerM